MYRNTVLYGIKKTHPHTFHPPQTMCLYLLSSENVWVIKGIRC